MKIEEKSEREISADMERLRLIREKRAADAAKRVADEGYDRYAPVGSKDGKPKREDK